MLKNLYWYCSNCMMLQGRVFNDRDIITSSRIVYSNRIGCSVLSACYLRLLPRHTIDTIFHKTVLIIDVETIYVHFEKKKEIRKTKTHKTSKYPKI